MLSYIAEIPASYTRNTLKLFPTDIDVFASLDDIVRRLCAKDGGVRSRTQSLTLKRTTNGLISLTMPTFEVLPKCEDECAHCGYSGGSV
ncbi:hypothetical protein GCM10009539_22740 [Cryptosporangium japonicum]|uniref:Uncharacterized protein n=1 Tax=Cryptosporangium japonicum TaxID=80872 RepID=A0ABN0U302_9ACTN